MTRCEVCSQQPDTPGPRGLILNVYAVGDFWICRDCTSEATTAGLVTVYVDPLVDAS